MDYSGKYFTCDGNGAVGRYIKLSIPNIEASNWIKINELEVNKTVEQEEIAGALSGAEGDYQNAVDGSLSTFYTPDDPAQAGYLQYLLPELTRPTAITVLQSPATISGAALLAQKASSGTTRPAEE